METVLLNEKKNDLKTINLQPLNYRIYFLKQSAFDSQDGSGACTQIPLAGHRQNGVMYEYSIRLSTDYTTTVKYALKHTHTHIH